MGRVVAPGIRFPIGSSNTTLGRVDLKLLQGLLNPLRLWCAQALTDPPQHSIETSPTPNNILQLSEVSKVLPYNTVLLSYLRENQ